MPTLTCAARPPIRRVAVLALPGVQPFELGVAWEGFGIDRTDEGVPAVECRVLTETGTVQTAGGYRITTNDRLDAAADADLLVVPAADGAWEPSPAAIELMQQTAARDARVMSVCSGAFALGAAGLLDDRECTTHWRHAEELQARHPRARVNPNVLYVCAGEVLTSAGTAAGLDLCLHLIRSDHGEEIARRVARRMVMPPYRDGGQAQYIEAPIRMRSADTLAPLLEALGSELGEEHSVESLAKRAAMSPRTFARRFRAETGTTPHLWLTQQRVLMARRMLEETDATIDTIAADCGFGTAAMLRHHFARSLDTSPASYRRAFRAARAS